MRRRHVSRIAVIGYVGHVNWLRLDVCTFVGGSR